MLLTESLQLVLGVNVLPDPLHVVPVSHHAVLHRVPDRKEATVLLGLIGAQIALIQLRFLGRCFSGPKSVTNNHRYGRLVV